jgi:hypothetical protein
MLPHSQCARCCAINELSHCGVMLISLWVLKSLLGLFSFYRGSFLVLAGYSIRLWAELSKHSFQVVQGVGLSVETL